jgi:murein DD-endopeptidase MepM/ murein hydrolase activator NlpD
MKRFFLPFLLGTTLALRGAIATPAQEPSRQIATTAAQTSLILPAHGLLTSGYGWRWGRMHEGIDIGAPQGSPVLAVATGTVEFAGWTEGGYGNLIEIRHADGSLTRYAHLSRILIQVGAAVTQGQAIGEVGSTGRSTGPHLHFELPLPLSQAFQVFC